MIPTGLERSTTARRQPPRRGVIAARHSAQAGGYPVTFLMAEKQRLSGIKISDLTPLRFQQILVLKGQRSQSCSILGANLPKLRQQPETVSELSTDTLTKKAAVKPKVNAEPGRGGAPATRN